MERELRVRSPKGGGEGDEWTGPVDESGTKELVRVYTDRREWLKDREQRKGLGRMDKETCTYSRPESWSEGGGTGDTDKRQRRERVGRVERCVNCNQIRDTAREGRSGS